MPMRISRPRDAVEERTFTGDADAVVDTLLEVSGDCDCEYDGDRRRRIPDVSPTEGGDAGECLAGTAKRRAQEEKSQLDSSNEYKSKDEPIDGRCEGILVLGSYL